jgi:hypothetical protein
LTRLATETRCSESNSRIFLHPTGENRRRTTTGAAAPKIFVKQKISGEVFHVEHKPGLGENDSHLAITHPVIMAICKSTIITGQMVRIISIVNFIFSVWLIFLSPI